MKGETQGLKYDTQVKSNSQSTTSLPRKSPINAAYSDASNKLVNKLSKGSDYEIRPNTLLAERVFKRSLGASEESRRSARSKSSRRARSSNTAESLNRFTTNLEPTRNQVDRIDKGDRGSKYHRMSQAYDTRETGRFVDSSNLQESIGDSKPLKHRKSPSKGSPLRMPKESRHMPLRDKNGAPNV